MLEEEIEDTHLCIKCSTTIVGLDNYVQHRKNHCSVKSHSPRNVHSGDHHQNHHHHGSHFESFDFNEAQSSSFTKHNEKANKSISESYDLPYDLGADIFFQSLELQSSSKRSHHSTSAPTSIPSTIIRSSGNLNISPPTGKNCSNSGKVNSRKSANILVSNHSDEWIHPTTSNNSDNLMKAVRDISGTKKCDSIFKLIPFQHDSPVQSDEGNGDDDDLEDDEELDDEEHYYLGVLANNTGGKWKPENNLRHSLVWENNHHWSEYKSNNKEIDDFENDLIHPPPSHTKGKWVPGSKVVKLNYKDDVEIEKIFAHQYWCNTCNRKLASKILYERHLKSNLHLKRAKPEQELETAALQTMSERLKKPSIYLNTTIYSTGIESPVTQENLTESGPLKVKKRKRRKYFIKCETCNIRLPKYLLGKHLISHYHYRRMIVDPSKSLDMILENIHRIVYQSPFQCQSCRFYCNTEEDFILHWNCNAHLDLNQGSEKFWCTFCKFECEDNNQMRDHLLSSDHKEVVLVINRSVPIVIRKKIIIKCTKCEKKFRYNIELRKHAKLCSKEPLGTASNDYQSKFTCETCGYVVKSLLALQKHEKVKHSRKFYFCSFCKVQLKSAVDSLKHRSTSKHKIMMKKVKHKNNLSRKCKLCFETFSDLNFLKEHITKFHSEDTHSCSYCGEKFAIPQILGRHVRDKVCRTAKCNGINFKNQNLKLQHIEISQKQLYGAKELSPENLFKNNTKCTEKDENSIKDFNIEYAHPKTGETKDLICQLCDFKTTSTAELIFHEILHSLPVDYNNKLKLKCPICCKMLRKHSLRLHIRLHTNERRFPCSHCESTFVRKSNLKEHIDNIHLKLKSKSKTYNNKNKTTLKCDICDKKYENLHSFNHHLSTHTQCNEHFKCNFVDCIFNGRNLHDLKMHQTVHTDESFFECNYDGCCYKGKNLVNLKKHQKVHLNLEKKFVCTECNFESKYSTHLKRHRAIHSGEKAFQCLHCNYASSSKENLRKHILKTIKHSGKFLYECSLCDQTDKNKFRSNFEKEYRSHLILFHKIEKDLNKFLKNYN